LTVPNNFDFYYNINGYLRNVVRLIRPEVVDVGRTVASPLSSH
jgi:hypothetical protein